METNLDRVIKGRAEYNRLCRKVEELISLSEKTTTSLTKAPVSGSGGDKDSLWAQLADYKSQCEFQLLSYIRDCAELERELECIRDAGIRTAMKYKYIDAKTIHAIADEMGYSERHIDRLIQKGKSIYLGYYGN